MRIAAALLMLLLLGTFAPVRTTPPEPPPALSWLRFEALEGAPERVGLLEFLGGWSIESNDPRFGGLSALYVEGREALAFSDAGWRIGFPLPVGSGPAGPVQTQIAALPDSSGSGNKSDSDVESMAVFGPFVWLGLERRNAVVRHERESWRATASNRPRQMERWRANRGAEAMVRLRDGRFLVFSEGSGGLSEALLFLGDPAVHGTSTVRMRYRPPEGFRITDAAVLPDGKLLFLNRRFEVLGGFTARLTMGRLPEARNGAVIDGEKEEVAHLRRPFPVDNMEGLSVTEEEGRTILWLASDDNYNGLQRTLLLKLRAALPAHGKAPAGAGTR